MVPHPEDELDVVVVPAVAQMMREKAPRVVVVLVGKEDANTLHVLRVTAGIVSPDYAEIERTGRRHDGDVWEDPAAVVVG